MRPENDNSRRPVSGPHLRYVQIYSVTTGVASVLLLAWDGAGFVPYGSPFAIGGTYTTDDLGKQLWITWRSDAQAWFQISGTAGTAAEKYRLIRGKAFGNVDGDDETFNIDGIVVLAGGLDPRSVAGDPDEQLEIENYPGETFSDNETVVAIYREADDTWEVLAVERFRVCKGDYYSTTDSTHIVIENVEPLASGLYPLVDIDGRLTVTKLTTQTYGSGDVVVCDYNDPTEEWEARPKASGGGSGSQAVWGQITTPASPSPNGVPTTDCVVTLFAAFGGGVLTGVKNYSPDTAPAGRAARVDVPEGEDGVLGWWSCNETSPP